METYSEAATETPNSAADADKATEQQFRMLSLVAGNSLPTKEAMKFVQDPFVRSLPLDDRRVVGKHFAFFDTMSVRKLFDRRYVVFIGDSVVRGMYKDMVHMINDAESLVWPGDLTRKTEISHEGDQLLHGWKLSGNEAEKDGINYEELRMFLANFSACKAQLRFCFTTRIWNTKLFNRFKAFFKPQNSFGFPDVIFINSCLWDLARYEITLFEKMKDTYKYYLERMIDSFAEQSKGKSWLVVMSTLPVSKRCTGAFIEKERGPTLYETIAPHVEKMNEVLLEMVNLKRAKGVKVAYLDLFSFSKNLQLEQYWMETDGTHWKSPAHRIYSLFILSFLSRLLGHRLPKTSPESFYQSCDDFFRYFEYIKWLIFHKVKTTGMSLEDIERRYLQTREAAPMMLDKDFIRPNSASRKDKHKRNDERKRPVSRSPVGPRKAARLLREVSPAPNAFSHHRPTFSPCPPQSVYQNFHHDIPLSYSAPQMETPPWEIARRNFASSIENKAFNAPSTSSASGFTPPNSSSPWLGGPPPLTSPQHIPSSMINTARYSPISPPINQDPPDNVPAYSWNTGNQHDVFPETSSSRQRRCYSPIDMI